MLIEIMNIKKRIFGSITSVHTDRYVAAITFDDGPHPDSTIPLLDMLAKYDAKATFFLVGRRAEKYPDLIKKILCSGHAIGNHSYDHQSFPELNIWDCIQQIKQFERIIFPFKSDLVRPPYGHQSIFTRVLLGLLGYKSVMWNSHAEDWVIQSEKEIEEKLQEKLKPGNIILLHEKLYSVPVSESAADSNVTNMLRALDMFLKKNTPQYQFLTVSDLLKTGKEKKVIWVQKAPPNWLASLQNSED